MRTRLLSTIAIAALLLTACGGSGADQGEVADMLMDAAEEEDFDLDRDCVEDVAGKLSDDDAKRIVDAGPEGDAQLSAEGEALANEIFDCVDTDALVDSMIAPILEDLGEDNVDVDCIKEAFRDIDPSNIDDSALSGAMLDCVDLGG
jgi:hypothetical protein